LTAPVIMSCIVTALDGW